jgi:hypothetical protein
LLDTDVDEDGHGLLSHWLHPAVGWLSDSDVQRITSAVVFMALLLAAYGLTRSLCFVGIPYDGTRSWDAFDVTSDAEKARCITDCWTHCLAAIDAFTQTRLRLLLRIALDSLTQTGMQW